MSSCSDDESDDSGCNQDDWVGTYNLEANFMCPDSSVELDEEFILESSSVENTLISGGDTITFIDCSATILGLVNLELDGDILTASAFGCEGEYTRQ